ncbi:hypothetical protein RUMHYD_00574 [Blautia hydrogenotrophica DSM 10507]|uniref:Uncharacterized protein n=1 Tax=Blautia hydrogenotrophica (strain DSM 10507 / JCM 14656 / S5a33) TaxID=476272 RepID=C0CIA9_BLAHS|nr:hypothetical protein RUMHYD_00574 [Blautia hydrogenotrophica DSM 10507]
MTHKISLNSLFHSLCSSYLHYDRQRCPDILYNVSFINTKQNREAGILK